MSELAKLRAVLMPRANHVAKPFPLTGEQVRFLRLHAYDTPTKWQWLWGSTILRASTERNHTATIPAAEFDELVRLGLVRRSGMAGAVITDKGRDAI